VAALLSFAAPAASAEEPSRLALTTVAADPGLLGVDIRPAQDPTFAERAANGLTTLAAVVSPYLPRVENAGVRYRPRESRYRRGSDSYGVSQLHVGFFDPEGDLGERFLVGLRGGPMIDPNIQLGLGVDWVHKTEKASSVTSTQEGPGGIPIEVRQDLARASTNLFPIMAFIQVSAKDDMPVIPYFGLGGGYQVMVLSAEDFREILRLAAGQAGRFVRVLGFLGQPFDHTQLLAFPEGRYLKVLALEVTGIRDAEPVTDTDPR